MIDRWSYVKSFDENEIVLDATDPYFDKGKILNYELTEPINLIGLLIQKKQQQRQSFSSIQEQKCLVTKGQFISVLKNLKENNSIIETQLVKKTK